MSEHRSYSELIKLPSFEDRFNYLQLKGLVGTETFGYDRVFNQKFYTSYEWKNIRRKIIDRDGACDLGIPGREIFESRFIYIHHMNPVSLNDVKQRTDILLNPEFLICTSFETHNAIHYGRKLRSPPTVTERKPYDTCPWRKQ